MLRLSVKGAEYWDSAREEFIYTKPTLLTLEHSLVSVSKWEARWKRSFLDEPPKTPAEELDYIRCMTITQNVPPETYTAMTAADRKKVNDYIEAPMTATTISSRKGASGKKGTKVTSELIYYWMIEFGIPFECEKWHLNRLMTLIRICEIKQQAPKKRSQKDIMRENTDLNRKRRAMLHTKG